MNYELRPQNKLDGHKSKTKKWSKTIQRESSEATNLREPAVDCGWYKQQKSIRTGDHIVEREPSPKPRPNHRGWNLNKQNRAIISKKFTTPIRLFKRYQNYWFQCTNVCHCSCCLLILVGVAKSQIKHHNHRCQSCPIGQGIYCKDRSL